MTWVSAKILPVRGLVSAEVWVFSSTFAMDTCVAIVFASLIGVPFVEFATPLTSFDRNFTISLGPVRFCHDQAPCFADHCFVPLLLHASWGFGNSDPTLLHWRAAWRTAVSKQLFSSTLAPYCWMWLWVTVVLGFQFGRTLNYGGWDMPACQVGWKEVIGCCFVQLDLGWNFVATIFLQICAVQITADDHVNTKITHFLFLRTGSRGPGAWEHRILFAALLQETWASAPRCHSVFPMSICPVLSAPIWHTCFRPCSCFQGLILLLECMLLMIPNSLLNIQGSWLREILSAAFDVGVKQPVCAWSYAPDHGVVLVCAALTTRPSS